MKAVNLLPSEQRGSGKTSAAVTAPVPKAPAGGAYAVLGFLAIVVVAAAVYVLAGNRVTDRRAELARTTQEAQAVSKQAADLQSYAEFKALADARRTTVRDLAKARFDWPLAFYGISRTLPADVHLRTMSGTVTTNSSAAGGNSLRSAIQSPAIELSGCTTSQTGVARMMSRLHDVRGVTRVSLSSSTRSETPAAAAAAPGMDGERLCPKGSPPDFEVVIFFERAQLGAGAIPNATAGATGTAAAAGTTGTPSTQTAGTTTAGATATPAPGAAATPAPTTTSTTTATQGVSAK
jgi:Tfp pilus assembly protein PilN